MKKKIFKRVLLLILFLFSLFGVYWYFTLLDVRLATVVNRYEKVEHKDFVIKKDYINNFSSIQKKDKEDFKILQLTDLHIGGSTASYDKDILAFSAMYDLIKYSKPDLIVLTGDMMFSSIASRNINNKNASIAIKIFFENVGIPWTITFGNHDYEFYNTDNHTDIASVFETSNNFIFLPYYAYDRKMYSNHQINLLNEDGSLNRILFFMDSNMLTSSDDSLMWESLYWYQQRIFKNNERYGTFNSLLFLHEPLYEYNDAWNNAVENSDFLENKYYYGKKRENICYEKKTDLFRFIKTYKGTDGVFCGHDHLNDFSVEYQGVRLTYGNSIDYITYDDIASKEEQRGGTLISIKDDGNFDVTQIILKDIRKND